MWSVGKPVDKFEDKIVYSTFPQFLKISVATEV
jgi:hypothetical protein